MRNARLAIDLRYAAGPLSGFGRFTWTLIEGLAEIGPPEPILLIRRRSQAVPDALAGTPGFAWKVVERAPYEPLGQWRLARELAQDGIRVMVSPDCFAPLAGPLEQVITVHDIIPLRCPELLPRSAKGRSMPGSGAAGCISRCLARRRVLTVSDHARQRHRRRLPRSRAEARHRLQRRPHLRSVKSPPARVGSGSGSAALCGAGCALQEHHRLRRDAGGARALRRRGDAHHRR